MEKQLFKLLPLGSDAIVTRLGCFVVLGLLQGANPYTARHSSVELAQWNFAKKTVTALAASFYNFFDTGTSVEVHTSTKVFINPLSRF